MIARADAGVVVLPKHHECDQNYDENDDGAKEQVELHDKTVRSGHRDTGDVRPLDTR